MDLRSTLGALAAVLSFTGIASAEAGPDAGRAGEARARRAHVAEAGEGAEMRTGGPAAAFRPAENGAEVPSRVELRTKAAPLRFVLADGTRVVLAPNSRVGSLGPIDVALDRGGKIAPERFELYAGEIRVELPATIRATSMLVATHDLLIAPLPGSKLRVRARTSGGGAAPVGLAIAADEGEARFTLKGSWKPLGRGQAVEAILDLPIPSPSILPAPPEWATAEGACATLPARARPRTDCPLAVVTSAGDVADLALGWRAASGANSYSLEIARDAGFGDIVARHDTPQRLAVTPLPVGRYFARVVAEGAAKMPGLPSAAREIRVVHVDLPQGSALRDGAVHLPRARRIKLGAPQGLELAMGASGFSTAPTQFGLPADAPLTARLRTAGSPGFVEMALTPSTLRASIKTTPKNVTWPFDPLVVHVEVSDGGSPVPTTFEPKFVVNVNANVVPTEWWRRGNVWRAQIEPHVPPGPWVVRVEVLDPHDNEIGRAFVEVAGPPPPVPVASR